MQVVVVVREQTALECTNFATRSGKLSSWTTKEPFDEDAYPSVFGTIPFVIDC